MDKSTTTMHSRNHDRFASKVDDYSQYRPEYPRSVPAEILREAGPLPARITAADVGAGTGISSRLLASAGWTVIAVEPNAKMLEALTATAGSGVEARQGSAERTGLNSGSVDVVTAFQAFHWFPAREALQEFHRILRPHGLAALVWNVRSKSDPFTLAYSNIVEEYMDRSVSSLLQRKEDTGGELLKSQLFESGVKRVLSNTQALDLTGLLGRARSVSYLPTEGPRYNEIVANLTMLYEQWQKDGLVHLQYEVLIYVARRRSLDTEQQP